MKLELRPCTDPADTLFAHDVTYINMHEYVLRHWGGWDREIFFANFAKSDNYIGWRDPERIGLVRLVWHSPVLVIEDLQVLPTEQNKGYGRGMMEDVLVLAQSRDCQEIRLRVFDENPARRLYERMGFVNSERDGQAWWMRLSC